jgi:hypothetical protein
MHSYKYLLVFLVTSLLFLCPDVLIAQRSNCDLRLIDVEPTNPGDYRTYSGRGKVIELVFVNDRPGKPADVFPEPAIILKNITTGEKCQIEGGIWIKDRVYLTSDEKVAGLGCYSGSSVRLQLYDTETCHMIASTGKGYSDFSFTGPYRISLFGQFESLTENTSYCCPSSVVALTPACEFLTLEHESIELTTRRVGIPIHECVEVLFPGTNKAELNKK